jgi:hypothetical protein
MSLDARASICKDLLPRSQRDRGESCISVACYGLAEPQRCDDDDDDDDDCDWHRHHHVLSGLLRGSLDESAPIL